MTNRHTLKLSLLVLGIVAFALPGTASAQWGRGRDRDDGYGRYDERALRDSVQRLDRLSKDFERNIDRALDRSRANGSDREDRINDQVHQFRDAVGDLKSRVGNGRDLNRSADEARRVLQEGQQLDRIARPRWFDNRLASDWSQIQRELRLIGDVYGFRFNGGGGRRDDDYRRRDNRNDDWRRRIPFPQ
ncbi:MAG TPA: hypothetical protein VJT15_07075 [Pyrinomonadaceae bacterium]|nr:hypothetical protein [Pyrinomonadaceae bacterium]